MRARLLLSACAAAAVAVALCVALGVTWSLVYWGYAFAPPSIAPLVHRFARIEGYEEFEAPWLTPGRDAPAGRPALIRSARLYDTYATEFELGKLAAELVRQQRLPSSEHGIGAATFQAVGAELHREGVLFEGAAGYPNAKNLYGALALGRDATGRAMIVACVGGSQVSNDHYPRYQALFVVEDGSVTLIQAKRYFVDIAGIEGVRWWHVSAVLTVLLTAPIVGLTMAFVRFGSRRRRAGA